MNCPNHGTELVNRKGISKKTGRSYDFWACTQKEGNNFCDYTYNPVPKATTSSAVSGERQELIGKVLAQIIAGQSKLDGKIDRVLERLDEVEKDILSSCSNG